MAPLPRPTPGGELLLDPGMARRAPHGRPDLLFVALTLIAALAVLVPTLMLVSGVGRTGYRDVIALPGRVLPRAQVPPVEPVRLVALAPDAARAFNAAQPFASGAIPAARPFRFAGGPDDLARATDCLAAAELYEAGDDTVGERAVAQVVLNRLRHPAFPKSVCAVVFEGSERATGCQFTFTCDGALTRWRPSEAGWARAHAVATAALAGAVDRDVGYATHYHTDWVVPYWQASLDKVAAVHTHLFFRWSGWWGTPAAFDRRPTGAEPVIAKLAAISGAHGGAMAEDGENRVDPAVPFFGRTLRPLVNDPDTFLTSIDPAQPPESYRTMALQACGERARCKVLGWSDPGAMAFTLPLSAEAQAAMSFSYLRDRASGLERALWNCGEFRNAPVGACMKRSSLPAASAAAAPRPITDGDPIAADELGGVRRRSDTKAASPVASAKPVTPRPIPAATEEPPPLSPRKGDGRTAREG